MNSFRTNLLAAAVGISFGALIFFAIIGVVTVAVGPSNLCRITAHLGAEQ